MWQLVNRSEFDTEKWVDGGYIKIVGRICEVYLDKVPKSIRRSDCNRKEDAIFILTAST